MRRIILVLCFVLCLSCSAYARPRATVRAFEDRTEEQNAPAGAIMDMMVTELSKAGVFDLMERERMDYLADEIRLGQSGLMDPETAPQVGRIKGVQYTMTGAITLYYFEEKASGFSIPIIGQMSQAQTAYVLLELRIFDNATGQIVYTADKLGTAKRASKGASAYKDFFIGSYKKSYGGILASAAREAVMQHVDSIKAQNWE